MAMMMMKMTGDDHDNGDCGDDDEDMTLKIMTKWR